MAQLIFAAGRMVRSYEIDLTPIIVETTDSTNNESNHGSRLAHYIAMMLKDAEMKFSGDFGEYYMDYVDDYSQVASDYSLNLQRKLQYFHKLLSNDAKRFYVANLEAYS